MKKKLEAELISIAHRILKLTNKSDLIQLHQETQRLYEKLSVLRFVEENFTEVKPTIGYREIEDKLAVIFANDIPETLPEVDNVNAKAEEASAESKEVAENTQQDSEETSDEKSETSESEVTEETETNADSSEENIETNEAEPVAELEIPEEEVSDVEDDISGITAEGTVHPEEVKQQEISSYSAPIPQENKENETTYNAKAFEEDAKESAIVAEELKPIETITENNFRPAFELSFEAKEEPKQEVKPEVKESRQVAFDELLGQSYVDPVFVKPEDLQREKDTLRPIETKIEAETKPDVIVDPEFTPLSGFPANAVTPTTPTYGNSTSSSTLNDRMAKGITIGLNDRIAFMKHLFNNSSEDYNRVLSQLITFGSMQEAVTFIDEMVKPDYNNWEGKDEYAQRFMEIIEKKFS